MKTPDTEENKGAKSYYHIWFSPKRRKWLLQGEVRDYILASLRDIAAHKGYKLIACEAMPEHIHLLLGLDASTSLTKCIKDFKGASARAVFQAFPELKMDIGENHFWQRRFGSREISSAEVPMVVRYVTTQDSRLARYERCVQVPPNEFGGIDAAEFIPQ